MTPFAPLAIMAASILSVMAAPATTSNSLSGNTTFTGYASYFEEQRNACPEIKYSLDEPVAAVHPSILNSADGSSVCGKYVQLNREDDPSRKLTFRIVDACTECDEDSVDLSTVAMERFPDLHREMVPVEWQVVDAPIAESLDAPVSTAHNSLSKRAVKLKGKVFRGRGTWFSDTMGSCGRRFSQSDMIVALNQAQMGKMYGKGSKCGRKIRVTAKENPNRSVIVTIVDTCPNRYCRHGQLDLSRAAFKKFAPMKKGILSLQWAFV